jgi:hypothetical protein
LEAGGAAGVVYPPAHEGRPPGHQQ